MFCFALLHYQIGYCLTFIIKIQTYDAGPVGSVSRLAWTVREVAGSIPGSGTFH